MEITNWINVNDDLPELFDNSGYKKSKIVAALIGAKEPIMVELNTGLDENSEEWMQWFSHQYDDVVTGITHWMPLPNPPTQ